MISNGDVMGAADDGQHLCADLNPADQEAPTAGMRGDLDDSPHDNTFERLAPVFQVLDFYACHGKLVSHDLSSELNGYELAQPLEAHTHRLTPRISDVYDHSNPLAVSQIASQPVDSCPPP
jgi:hypothetical protein